MIRLYQTGLKGVFFDSCSVTFVLDDYQSFDAHKGKENKRILKMFAETLCCQFHQYKHCKFGLKSRKFHTRDTCPNFMFEKKNCSKMHPKQCKFFVLNGRCKLAENCSFRYVSSEKVMKNAME